MTLMEPSCLGRSRDICRMRMPRSVLGRDWDAIRRNAMIEKSNPEIVISDKYQIYNYQYI